MEHAGRDVALGPDLHELTLEGAHAVEITGDLLDGAALGLGQFHGPRRHG
jgi:hypothetical protein